MGRNKEQASREFGIKFAKALQEEAGEAAAEHDLDARGIMLGASEYLRNGAGFDPPLDPSRTDPAERGN